MDQYELIQINTYKEVILADNDSYFNDRFLWILPENIAVMVKRINEHHFIITSIRKEYTNDRLGELSANLVGQVYSINELAIIMVEADERKSLR